ncbi:MAG: response regulator [Pyrinomonadaceae bacterium]
MNESYSVLLIGRDAGSLTTIAKVLGDAGFRVDVSAGLYDLADVTGGEGPDLIIHADADAAAVWPGKMRPDLAALVELGSLLAAGTEARHLDRDRAAALAFVVNVTRAIERRRADRPTEDSLRTGLRPAEAAARAQHDLGVRVHYGRSVEEPRRQHDAADRDKLIERLTDKQRRTEEEAAFQAFLLDTVEQAVFATDREGRITYWNKFASRLYGWERVEVIGRNILDVVPDDGSLPAAEEVVRQLRNRQSWYGEIVSKRKDGDTFPAYLQASPLVDSEGRLVGLIGIARDNTEQARARAQLAEANRRAIDEYVVLLDRLGALGQSLAGAHDIGSICDAVLQFTVSSVPCSALFISRYDAQAQQRSGMYLWYSGQTLPPEELGIVPVSDGPVGRAIATGETAIVNDYLELIEDRPEKICYGFDADPRVPRSAIIAPMAIMGRVIGTIEVQSYEPGAYTQEHASAMRLAASLLANAVENVDLIEQMITKGEQLRQAQKLESVGRLAGGIAHDFNNMLTTINGYSELTLRRLAPDDPLRRNIEAIKKAGERSAALTHQMLAFSRRQVLQPQVMNINDPVEEVRVLLERLIGENISLELDLAEDAGFVEADPSQLTQVIMNLAVNARDAMPAGGQLLIQTRNADLDENFVERHLGSVAGRYALLSVSDTGTGMPEETQKHIFEPFFTTKDLGKGTGLGLATVYGIVKQSGGYIWCKSVEGVGTTFDIYLPRVAGPEPAPESPSKPESVGVGSETILLVEDEDLVRDFTAELLRSCGYEVVQASDGVQALEMFEGTGRHFDLLLTDMVMPRMSGRELAARLSETRPGMKVLFMSGYTDDFVARDGVAANSNFIAKPFTLSDLATKVRECLDGPARTGDVSPSAGR